SGINCLYFLAISHLRLPSTRGVALHFRARPALVILSIIGIFLMLSGLLFFLQGTGIFPYPKSSFMINETIWIIRGAILFVVGLIVLLIGRRFRRPVKFR
ncbi:hypothetical protein A6P07_16725, partial [Acidithiobacillus thiooxidans]